VHSLTVKFPPGRLWGDATHPSHKSVASFLGALSRMHALSDLRIMLPVLTFRVYPQEIDNALRSVCLTHHSIVAYR